MKICILTFHWATNYGAVLQTYALSQALKSRSSEVDIVDYYPKKYKNNYFNVIRARNLRQIKKRIKDVSKDRVIEDFRKKHLKRTRYYSSDNQLKRKLSEYDCYICGSDQVWNMSFILHGELKRTFVYFLDFVPAGKIKASYAASFGTVRCDGRLRDGIKEALDTFDFISVRENTGLEILNDIGINNGVVVPDPTLLLDASRYEALLDDTTTREGTFVYMLHNRDNDASQIIEYIKSRNEKIYKSDSESVEQWLANIKYADRVITNSFHGVVFSILFEKPFMAILINGSGMNDRLTTLIQKLGLESRIFDGDVSAMDKPIDWQNVKDRLNDFRKSGYDYLDKVLNEK